MPETKKQTRPEFPFDRIRELALALPDAIELDHHGRSSFRVSEKIFATIWDENHVNVMLDPIRILEVARENPRSCAEFWWGRQLRCVSVDVRYASAKLLRKLFKEAWERKTKKARKKGSKKENT